MEKENNIYKCVNSKSSMNKRGMSFWDAVIWIGIAIILIWAILKSLGIINSPIWVDMLPYYGIGVGAIGGAYKLGKIMDGIERTQRKVDNLLRIENRLNEIERSHNQCLNGELKGSPYKRR